MFFWILQASVRVFWKRVLGVLAVVDPTSFRIRMEQYDKPITDIQHEGASSGGHGRSFSLPFLFCVHQLLIVGYVFESQFLPNVWLPPLAKSVEC
jgi:hypothetical protein